MSPRTLTLAAVGLLAGTALLTTGSADAKRRQKPPATTTSEPAAEEPAAEDPVEGPKAGAGGARPNVLVVVLDDVGVDKIGAYASDASPTYRDQASQLPATPTADKLAAKGVRFTDAWAYPTCSPTRATAMTGTHAFRHGVGVPVGYPGSKDLDTDIETLADVAAGAGYATALFGKWHLGDGYDAAGFASGEGWEEHLDQAIQCEIPPVAAGWAHVQGTPKGAGFDGEGDYMDWLQWECQKGGTTLATRRTDHATEHLTEDALAWIGGQTGPWLAWVAYNAPHDPFQAPPASCGHPSAGQQPQSETETYRLMLECVDAQVGRLLDGVPDLAETLVILVGDNGTEDAVSEDVFHDGRGKSTLYENGVRVPFIIADGSDLAAAAAAGSTDSVTRPGRTEATPVHVVDLFATVTKVVGGTATGGQDSVNLMPLLKGRALDRGPVYSESFSATGGTAALRDGDWKLIVKAKLGASGCRQGYELYDLSSDRLEQTDLASSQSGTLDTLKGTLNGLLPAGSWLDLPDCG